MEKIFIPMNLQFFAEGNDDNDNTDVPNPNGDNGDGDNNPPSEVDVAALAEIISEKDKVIEQLQKDVASLKKSNAQLTVMINSDKSSSGKKSFEDNLLSMVGAKPRKE